MLGPSCLSRGRCRRVAGALPGRCRCIENLFFLRENQGFFLFGIPVEAAAGGRGRRVLRPAEATENEGFWKIWDSCRGHLVPRPAEAAERL